MSRIEWIKFVMQYGRPETRARQFLLLIVFEVYYHLCTLRGYRPRHFLEPLSKDVMSLYPGDPVLLTWPRLPLSVRLLDRIIPFGSSAHAEIMPYTAEADAAARRMGRRTATIYMAPGEFKAGNQ